MTRALILKELREHAWVLAALLLLQALTLAVLMINGKNDGSVFMALRQFALSLGVLSVLVVNNRLVVREYSGRTQLFLETLPVTRRRVMTVKLLLGAVLVLLPLAAAIATCALVARGKEPLTARYLAIIAARCGMFLIGVHGLAFLAGMLGRYRFVFWATLGVGYSIIDEKKSMDASSMPLLRLLDHQMPFERHHFPFSALLIVALITAASIAAALALGLTREGGLAANLARKMSHREKVFFLGLAIVLFVIQNTISERKPRPLFELAKAARVKEGATFVGIATGDDEETTTTLAQATGTALAADLESLRLWLGMTQMPPVFVVPDSSLDPDVFIRARLQDTDGVVLKAPLENEALDARAFRADALDEVMAWYSRGRSLREDVRWFSGGLAHWWVVRNAPDERLALREAAAPAGIVTVEALRDWLTTRETLGPCLADAIQTQLVTLLAEREGDAAFRALANATFGGERPPNDARATLMRRTLAAPLEPLVAAFNARLAVDRVRFADSLAKLQHLRAQLDAQSVGNGSGIEVHHAVESIPPAVEPIEYTLRYADLSPWEGVMSNAWTPRFTTRGKGVLPQVYVPGSRLFWAFEVDEPVLGCTVRFASARQVLQ